MDLYKTKTTKAEDIQSIESLGRTQGILEKLKTNVKTGITTDSIAQRKAEYGDNFMALPARDSFWSLCMKVLEDLMLQILLVCAFISIGVDMGFAAGEPEKLKTAWIEGFAILIAVAVVTFVSAWSDYQKEGQFIAQQMLANDQKKVS